MITFEQAYRILEDILQEKYSLVATKWREDLRKDSEQATIKRGLLEFNNVIRADASCVLHGWIDQAVLEIIAIAPLEEIEDETLIYRAQENGDTGVMTIHYDSILVLDFSYDDEQACILEYKEKEIPKKIPYSAT